MIFSNFPIGDGENFFSVVMKLLKLFTTCLAHCVAFIKDFKNYSYVPKGSSLPACASECVREGSDETFSYMTNSIILNFLKLFPDNVESNI